MSSFSLNKVAKLSENTSALQGFLLITNTQQNIILKLHFT